MNSHWNWNAEKETERHRKRSAIYLTLLDCVQIEINRQRLQWRETVDEGEITTVNRWFGKTQHPLLSTTSLTYSLNYLEKHTFLLKTVPASPTDTLSCASNGSFCSLPATQSSYKFVSPYSPSGRSIIRLKASAGPWVLNAARITCSQPHMCHWISLIWAIRNSSL